MTNLYPFLSKAQISTRIEEDPAFALECLQIMCSRQTAFEQESKTTVVKNRRGFMSSHAVNGTLLAVKARTEGLDEVETAKAQEMVSHYTKQLASHFRAEALERDPSLAATARVFGV
jgi:hypothetical protein